MKKKRYPNKIEFVVHGNKGLFTDPIMKLGEEKLSYQIPTYEALKGALKSCYWKPTLIYFIDKVRIMNPIQMQSIGQKLLREDKECDLAYNTYLTNCCYQVQAHFEWNRNRPELEEDRNWRKHYEIVTRAIKHGSRRDVFLGARECQSYIEPCTFGEGKGFYDNSGEIHFGFMYHGVTYPDEAYSPETMGRKTRNFWWPVMKNGIIEFLRPDECPVHEDDGPMDMKIFDKKEENFVGLEEFEGRGLFDNLEKYGEGDAYGVLAKII